jgi:hypothetical protein
MNKLEIAEVKLSLPEVDVILQSMGQQPYDRVADLIANIRNQVITQINAANNPANPVDDKPEDTNPGGTD